jgi:hypothetical protein
MTPQLLASNTKSARPTLSSARKWDEPDYAMMTTFAARLD